MKRIAMLLLLCACADEDSEDLWDWSATFEMKIDQLELPEDPEFRFISCATDEEPEGTYEPEYPWLIEYENTQGNFCVGSCEIKLYGLAEAEVVYFSGGIEGFQAQFLINGNNNRTFKVESFPFLVHEGPYDLGGRPSATAEYPQCN